ncbi:hypothetical protein [Metabacillus sp. Hm71]|uniref:hypothetical protein n=1 Tax=Metabacillus sp. Hm71 TaxID=3450743 RepID=UPI003F427AB6
MAWYHWVAGWLIIVAGVVFTVIPDKPWWLWLAIFAVGGIGFLMVFLPQTKEEKYVDKEG